MHPLTSTTDTEPIKVKIIIPTHAYFLSGIRDFALNMVQNSAGFSRQWAFRFQTIVDELVNNAIKYGSAAGQEIAIVLEVEKEKFAAVTVADSGTGTDKKTAADLNVILAAARQKGERPSLELSGRGLQIVSNWSDEISFVANERGGISAMAKKNYSQEDEPLQIIQNEPAENALVLEV